MIWLWYDVHMFLLGWRSLWESVSPLSSSQLAAFFSMERGNSFSLNVASRVALPPSLVNGIGASVENVQNVRCRFAEAQKRADSWSCRKKRSENRRPESPFWTDLQIWSLVISNANPSKKEECNHGIILFLLGVCKNWCRNDHAAHCQSKSERKSGALHSNRKTLTECNICLR